MVVRELLREHQNRRYGSVSGFQSLVAGKLGVVFTLPGSDTVSYGQEINFELFATCLFHTATLPRVCAMKALKVLPCRIYVIKLMQACTRPRCGPAFVKPWIGFEAHRARVL